MNVKGDILDCEKREKELGFVRELGIKSGANESDFEGRKDFSCPRGLIRILED